MNCAQDYTGRGILWDIMARTSKKNAGSKHPKRAVKRKSPVKEKKHELPAAVKQTEHQVPPGYNVNTIVIMPVNSNTSFIYWEITDRLLNGSRRKLNSGSAQIMVKVFEADCLKEVCSFEVRKRIGKNYINYQPSLRPLVAEIGIMNGGGFKGLLKSGTVSSSFTHLPSTKKGSSPNPSATGEKFTERSAKPLIDPSVTKHEIWMTKTEDKYEIIRAPFSKKFTGSAEIIKYYQKTVGQHKRSVFSWI